MVRDVADERASITVLGIEQQRRPFEKRRWQAYRLYAILVAPLVALSGRMCFRVSRGVEDEDNLYYRSHAGRRPGTAWHSTRCIRGTKPVIEGYLLADPCLAAG